MENHSSKIYLTEKKPFTCLRSCDAYTGPINLVPLLGGKNIDFCPPLLPYY